MVSWARSSCELAESSKRFYTEKRKPVGPEVQGHKGEGWGEEDDPPTLERTRRGEGPQPGARTSPGSALSLGPWRLLCCDDCTFIYRELSEPGPFSAGAWWHRSPPTLETLAWSVEGGVWAGVPSSRA